MRRAVAVVLLSLASSVASAEVAVRVSAGRVDLTATAAPLADVLDRLARQTGMKVVYEGPAPRQLVTVSLHGRTPSETILAVFEGLGLNYAMIADATGASVQTLMVAGAASASTTSGTAPTTTRPNPPGMRRPFGPPPGSSPEGTEPGFDEGEQENEANDVDFTGAPPGAEAQDAGAAQQPGGQPANVPPVLPGAPQQGNAPPPVSPQPATPFSASPFTPQPQPFPPPPAQPAQPAQGNPQQGEEGKPQQSAPPQ
jgi:hypothetical protein